MRVFCSIFSILGGLALVAIGLLKPWYALPLDFYSNQKLVLRDASITIWWKGGCLLIAGVSMGWAKIKNSTLGLRGILTVGFAVMLPLALWYPQAVIMHDVALSGDAAWLQQQFDTLTWLGGDIPRGHSERPVPNGFGIWAQEPPHRLAAFRPPLFGSFSLGIAEVPDLIWWLGYNPAFSQFVTRGWIFFVLGILLTLVGCFGWDQYHQRNGQRRSLLHRTALALTGSAAIVLALAILPVILGGRALRRARDLTQSWQSQPALESLDAAGRWMPALRFDTGVVLQRGALQRQLGNSNLPAARLHEAWLLSDQGYSARATAIIDDLLAHPQSLDANERREALRALLRSAIDELNSSHLADARRHLDILLDQQPVCLQGWFHSQLVALESGDLGANRQAAQRVEALSKAYLRMESRGIVAASQWMLAQGELQSGNPESTVTARQRAQGR